MVIRGKVNHLLPAFPVGASFLMVGRSLDLTCKRKEFCLVLGGTALEVLSEVKISSAFLWKSSRCSCFVYFD